MSISTFSLTPDAITPVSGAGVFAEPHPTDAEAARLISEALQQHTANRTGGRFHHGQSTLDSAMRRGATPDYADWLQHVAPASGCTQPVRLAGEFYTVDTRTGRAYPSGSTETMPDGVLYKACGNRRSSICPACAEVYRKDTYQLILAGLQGGKGVPQSVQRHPCAFPTFTAPSFGSVHGVRTHPRSGKHLPCRPSRKPRLCPHGVNLSCNVIHHDGDKICGTPLCLDCYDHDHQVVWNAYAGELWRRTMQEVLRELRRYGTLHGATARPSYAKVAEFQARGVAHFHALVRIDGIPSDDNPDAVIEPADCFTYDALHYAIAKAVRTTAFRTPAHPSNPDGWLIEWGEQLLIKPVRINVDGQITETAVAGYLAKYATKATEAAGISARRFTESTITPHLNETTHTGRLLDACWRLGAPDPDAESMDEQRQRPYGRLRRWAHMLGFGGHFSTKSRRYSTTLRRLREARAAWRRNQHHTEDHQGEETTLVIGLLTYTGTGWHTTGDALLANSSAAKAREYARVAKEEIELPDELTYNQEREL